MVQSMNKVWIKYLQSDLIFHNKGLAGLFLNTAGFKFRSHLYFITVALNASEYHYWTAVVRTMRKFSGEKRKIAKSFRFSQRPLKSQRTNTMSSLPLCFSNMCHQWKIQLHLESAILWLMTSSLPLSHIPTLSLTSL